MWQLDHKEGWAPKNWCFWTFFFLSSCSASLVAQTVKNPPAMQVNRFNPWARKIPWRRKWQPTPVFLPGKSHGWRSLAGYSPWGCKESDTAEWFHFMKSININIYAKIRCFPLLNSFLGICSPEQICHMEGYYEFYNAWYMLSISFQKNYASKQRQCMCIAEFAKCC